MISRQVRIFVITDFRKNNLIQTLTLVHLSTGQDLGAGSFEIGFVEETLGGYFSKFFYNVHGSMDMIVI